MDLSTLQAFRSELEKTSGIRDMFGRAGEATGEAVRRKAREAGAGFVEGVKSRIPTGKLEEVAGTAGRSFAEGVASNPEAARALGGEMGVGMATRGEQAFRESPMPQWIARTGKKLGRIGKGAVGVGVGAAGLYGAGKVLKERRRRKEHQETLEALRGSRALPKKERERVVAQLQSQGEDG